ncbi:MAG: DUF3014 domain-containing protein [Acidobacteriota bacterium]
MSDLDDRTLVRAPAVDEPLAPPPPRSASTPIVIVALVGLLLGAAGAWWWTRDEPPLATEAPPPTTGTEVPLTPLVEPSRELPPLNQMDTFLRALLGALSSSPDLARWLATDDLIRQIAHGIDQLSRGASPAAELGVLKPSGALSASGRGRQLAINPASYRRFEPLASLVVSLDARAVADAYHTIHPRLDEAYRNLGRTDSSVDAAVALALTRLIETPTADDPVRLVPGPGASYEFADPRLEQLHPVQKQLLRMGPANAARIQGRLREIKEALAAAQPR